MKMTGPTSYLRRIAGFFISTDKTIPSDPGAHWTYLAIVLVMLILPFFITPAPEGDEDLALLGVRMPPSCPSRRFLNARCPGCGLTRSFTLLTHGRFGDAVKLHRIGIPLYLFFAYQVVFRILCLRRPEIVNSPRVKNVQHYTALVMIGLLVVNWIVGLATGQNGSSYL